MTTPKPEGQFWQAAVGDGDDPRPSGQGTGDRAGVPGARGGIGRQDRTDSLHHKPDM